MTFVLRSPDFADQAKLPMDFVHSAMGAGGQNVSPALQWEDAPPGTKSFALTMYDPDAPTGSGWWHWVVYDIPADATQLPRGAGAAGGAQLPSGARLGRTDFGSKEYGGAAPPPGHGPHRYIFTLYALNTDKLDVPADASAAMVGFMIHFAKLGEAKLTATYER
ncbi:YbhB/YbcL family Raf kinase inhibitor-like protein [Ramlibacter tataouinensis]|uniref:YbhB/YbcL family Raf kinase inhibitor-like protein n=1 Tax=Ramlibacter tataouinensis TaxID=94132 RepID=UPI0022F383F5|nr:YbhB/YbcL family Raf kinase inhibitor-like protein [Ramlibacter tataouinensis]WBY03027.1 YbhB/YbcL family Raf kinase inhibitor-like protein [Ramlibacter tataouinensis]